MEADFLAEKPSLAFTRARDSAAVRQRVHFGLVGQTQRAVAAVADLAIQRGAQPSEIYAVFLWKVRVYA